MVRIVSIVFNCSGSIAVDLGAYGVRPHGRELAAHSNIDGLVAYDLAYGPFGQFRRIVFIRQVGEYDVFESWS